MSNVLVLEGRSGLLVCHTARMQMISADGSVKWSAPVPNRAARMALSADKKVIAAFFHDGTVHWHRLSDGKEFLAFFPHPDQKRWVLWTPTGYYDAGPGSDSLIGWHVNRGRDLAADFFPVSRFREKFYRPDVIDQTLDERQALAQAGARLSQPVEVAGVLPPVVELAGPQQISATTETVTLRVTVRTPAGAPVTAVRVRVNGQAARDLSVQPVKWNGARVMRRPRRTNQSCKCWRSE